MIVTLDQIIILKEIYEEGSLTRAAEKLCRAKSALNYSIKSLEEQLGFKLIDKTSYRHKLTAKGVQFLFKSKPLLKEYDSLLESSRQLVSGVEVKLSISGSGVCSLEKLYRIIKKAMKKYPNTEITLIREILSGEKLLNNEEVDLALFENPEKKENFDFKKLYDFELPLVISANHEFLKLSKEDQTFQRLKKIPHIVQKSTLEGKIAAKSVEKDDIKWSVTDTLSKLELIENGLGWGRLPSHLIDKKLKSKEIVHLDHLDSRPYLEAYLCRQKNKEHGVVCNFIWDSFLENP